MPKFRMFGLTHGGVYNGMSNAIYHITKSIKDLGYEVTLDGKEPVDASISFAHPTWYDEDESTYRVGYSPWESDKMQMMWFDMMLDMDEIWAPTPLIKQWFEAEGVPVKEVYEHGLSEHIKTTKHEREENKPFRFLHVGEPATRKGGQIAYDAFIDAFGRDNPDVSLTFKHERRCSVRRHDPRGDSIGPATRDKNVYGISGLGYLDTLALYNRYDALVYPTAGEGFGFIPLEALGSGMPVITTHEWASYSGWFTSPGIETRFAKSPWQREHPGKMFMPQKDSLVDLYRDMYYNFEKYAQATWDSAPGLRKRYDWLEVTKGPIERLCNRLDTI